MPLEFELLLAGISLALGSAALGFAAGVVMMTHIVTAPYLAKRKHE